MAKKKTFAISSSLVQALGETVSAAKHYSGELNIDVVPLRKIELDPENPRDLALTFLDLYGDLYKDDSEYTRKKKEKETLQTLANSIKEQGVLNPIIVYKFGDKYRLITGERRTLASIICGKEDIQARILEGRPSQLTLGVLQWIENIEREDLSLWERLRNLEKITTAANEESKGSLNEITASNLSRIINCSLQHATNYKNVLGASSKLKLLIKSNKIKNLEKAALISRASENKQDSLMEACLNRATLKELKALAEKKAEVSVEKKQKGRGRLATRVNFGATKNIDTAKIIINSVLKNNYFCHLKTPILAEIQWDDFSTISEAFKKIIKIIEQTKETGKI